MSTQIRNSVRVQSCLSDTRARDRLRISYLIRKSHTSRDKLILATPAARFRPPDTCDIMTCWKVRNARYDTYNASSCTLFIATLAISCKPVRVSARVYSRNSIWNGNANEMRGTRLACDGNVLQVFYLRRPTPVMSSEHDCNIQRVTIGMSADWLHF